MKLHCKTGKSGVVLPTVMVLVLCATAIVAALVAYATRSMLLTRRSLDYRRAEVLAQSGLDLGKIHVKQLVYQTRDWQAFVGDYSTPETISPAAIPNYQGEYQNGVCFQVVSSRLSGGTMSNGDVTLVVYSIAKNPQTEVFAAVSNVFSVTFSRLGDYAAFYTRDLEAWPGENMTFKGKVHTNGDLYIGADKLLQFMDDVTAHGQFYASRKANSSYNNPDGSPKSGYYVDATGHLQFNKKTKDDGSRDTEHPQYADVMQTVNGKLTRIDSDLGNSWTSLSEQYYKGAVKTDQDILTPPINVNDDEHTIIERSKATTASDYNRDTEAAKFATKAALTMRFDSDGILHLYQGKYVEGRSDNEIGTDAPLMLPAKSVTKQSSVTGQYNVTQGTYVEGEGEEAHNVSRPAYEVARYNYDKYEENNPSTGEEGHYFYDRREEKAMAFADIYIDQILNDPTLRGYLYPNTSSGESGSSETATDEREPGVLYVTYDKETDGKPIGYPNIHTEQHGTGQYQTTGTDTKTVTSETDKNNLVAQGYTVASTSTTTKYYTLNRRNQWVETDLATYNRTASNKRKTETVTTYTLTRPIQTEIMETVAVTNYIPVEPAVRIRNASDLGLARSDGRPGLSIVTDLPMYVEGCFNTNGQKGNANDSCADKTAALVAADAVTMLSSNWQDNWQKPKWTQWQNNDVTSLNPWKNPNATSEDSNQQQSTRSAVETTFNGILMTGIVESNDNKYSGGLQNLFRFHENWRPNNSTKPYNFNGSMVCMWVSNIAKKPIEGTYTYQPPQRPWGWAQMDPPGLPNLTHLKEIGWGRLDSEDDYPANY